MIFLKSPAWAKNALHSILVLKLITKPVFSNSKWMIFYSTKYQLPLASFPGHNFVIFLLPFQNHRLWWRLYAYNLLVMDGILSRFKVKIIKKHACSWPRRGGHLLDFYIGPHDYHKTRQGCTFEKKEYALLFRRLKTFYSSGAQQKKICHTLGNSSSICECW